MSWYLPSAGRDPRAEFLAAHIPGAVFCDLDDISDRDTSLPHMLPSSSDFALAMGRLGVKNSDYVVVYDGSGVNLSAPRLWWLLQVFGHESVAVLDGGMTRWRNEGRPTEDGPVTPEPARFFPRFQPDMVRELSSMKANVEHPREQVLDARSPGRFQGTEPEPRPGLARGHIPGSRNLPFPRLVGPDGTLRDPAELRELFTQAGIDLTKPVVATCGSGVSACALLLGLRVLGAEPVALYDGSWSEWGRQQDR